MSSILDSFINYLITKKKDNQKQINRMFQHIKESSKAFNEQGVNKIELESILDAFNESIKFMNSIGIENLMNHEKELTNYALEKLKKMNSVKLVGNPKNKAGVISFTIKGIHPHDIATILDEDGVAIRAGQHCCQILHEKLNLSATARASFGVYNTKEDIDILCKGIENCRKVFESK